MWEWREERDVEWLMETEEGDDGWGEELMSWGWSLWRTWSVIGNIKESRDRMGVRRDSTSGGMSRLDNCIVLRRIVFWEWGTTRWGRGELLEFEDEAL